MSFNEQKTEYLILSDPSICLISGYSSLDNKDIFLHFLLIGGDLYGEDSVPAGRRSRKKGQNSHLAITALSISLPPSLKSGLKTKITYASVPCSWITGCKSVSSIYMHLYEIGKMGVRWSSPSSTYQNHWRAPPGNSVGVGQGPKIFIASKFSCDTQTMVQLLLSSFYECARHFSWCQGLQWQQELPDL